MTKIAIEDFIAILVAASNVVLESSAECQIRGKRVPARNRLMQLEINQLFRDSFLYMELISHPGRLNCANGRENKSGLFQVRFMSIQLINELSYILIAQVLKQIRRALKPEKPGPSSSICLKVV